MTVYFIRAKNGAVKIGYTRGPASGRLQILATSSPASLHLVREIPGDLGLEREFHAYFASRRIRGEWFKWCDEMLTVAPATVSTRYAALPLDDAIIPDLPSSEVGLATIPMVPLPRLPREAARMRKKMGLNIRDAAKAAKVSSATLSRVENKFPCDAKTYERISAWIVAGLAPPPVKP